MGYPISNRNSSQARAKVPLRVPKIFPDSLVSECSMFQFLVLTASLPSPVKYTTDIV